MSRKAPNHKTGAKTSLPAAAARGDERGRERSVHRRLVPRPVGQSAVQTPRTALTFRKSTPDLRRA